MAKKKMNTDCPLQVECGKACNHIGSENECEYYKANARPGMSMEKWDAIEAAEIARLEAEADEQNEEFKKKLKAVDTEERTSGKTLTYLPVDSILPHPDNPRKNIGDISELTESVRANGILQNLTVVPGDSFPGEQMYKGMFVVIIGHRRLAAAKAAGIEKVPCIVAEMTYAEQVHTMMVENMQRADLTPIEQADGFQMMLDLGYSKQDISEQTGFSKNTINKRLKLREFDRAKIEAAEARGGTLFDYMKLSEIKDEKTRNKLLDKVGTPDFLNSLKQSLNDQIREEDKARVLEIVKGFAKKMKNPNDRWGSKYDKVASYRLGSEPPCEVKPPKGDGPFEYYDSSWEVEVYTPAKKKPKEKKSEAQANYDKWMKETKQALCEISERHVQLRRDFINSLSEGKLVREKKHLEVLAMAAQCFSGIYTFDFDRYYDRDEIEKAFGIEWEGSYWQASDEDKEAAAKKLNEKPVTLLLLEVVSGFECYRNSKHGIEFWYEPYPSGIKENERGVKKLKVYYEFLQKLGYEMSEEEKKTIDGTLIAEITATEPPAPKK